jgi:hypothetical protein
MCFTLVTMHNNESHHNNGMIHAKPETGVLAATETCIRCRNNGNIWHDINHATAVETRELL